MLQRIDNFLSNAIKRISKLRLIIKEYSFFKSFQTRNEDIYVCTYFKSGTTWMQMILYQMLTDGDMNFNHIYDVSPWLMNEAGLTGDASRINALQSPRIFKSHEPYEKFDREFKGKIIHVIREGTDVAVSLTHHLKNYNNPNQTLDKTLKNYFFALKDYNWYIYNRDWYINSNKFDILYLNYEDLKNNFKNELIKISLFLNIELDSKKIERITSNTSFEFMKLHENKFGEQPDSFRIYNQFIRKGEVGEGEKELSEAQLKLYKNLFNNTLRKHIESTKNII